MTPVRTPVREVFSSASLRLLVGTSMSALVMGIPAFFVYLPTFAVQKLRLPASTVFYTLLLNPCLGVLSNLVRTADGFTVNRDTLHSKTPLEERR